MHIALTDEQAAFRRDTRAYFEGVITPEVRAALRTRGGASPEFPRVIATMGRDGLLGAALSPEHGGRGLTPIEQFLAFDESMRAGGPTFTTNAIAPALLEHGSDAMRAEILPRLLTGEITVCIGYSEPGAGSDLASLTTRAVRDGDVYVVNGQKTWTSVSTQADYVWLAARTDPEAPKHKGISLFLVPMDTPGIKLMPLQLVGDQDINQMFFEDVRVPASALIGAEHEGWRTITSQLNHERVVLSSSGVLERALDQVRSWAATTTLADGTRVIDQEWVQLVLARVHARLEFLRLMNWKNAWSATLHDEPEPADASATKVFGGEFYQEAFGALMEVLGQHAYLGPDAPGAALHAELEHCYREHRILTFAGGTSEIQRDLVATFGLGMPRTAR